MGLRNESRIPCIILVIISSLVLRLLGDSLGMRITSPHPQVYETIILQGRLSYVTVITEEFLNKIN